MIRALLLSIIFQVVMCNLINAQVSSSNVQTNPQSKESTSLTKPPRFSFHLARTNQPAAKTKAISISNDEFKPISTNGAEFRFQLNYPLSDKNTALGSVIFGVYNFQHTSSFSAYSSASSRSIFPFKYQGISAGFRRKLIGTSKHYIYSQASLLFLHYTPSSGNGLSFFSPFFGENLISYDLAINNRRTRFLIPEVGGGFTIQVTERANLEANLLYSHSFQKIIKDGTYTAFYGTTNQGTPSNAVGTISKFHQNLVFDIGLGISLF